MLNLLVTVFIGMIVRIDLYKQGQEPSMVSCKILCFVEDSMGVLTVKNRLTKQQNK